MEQQRNLIFILLLCAAMFLFWDWNSDKANDQKALEQAAVQQSQEINSNTAVGKVIKLISDNLELSINLQVVTLSMQNYLRLNKNRIRTILSIC